MAERAKHLVYQGAEGPRKGDYFGGVPARDLDERDIARLDDEQYAQIVGAHPTLGPLYVDPEAPPPADTLEVKTVEELRRIAAERGIDGRSGMNKAELVAAIEASGEAEGAGQADGHDGGDGEADGESPPDDVPDAGESED